MELSYEFGESDRAAFRQARERHPGERVQLYEDPARKNGKCGQARLVKYIYSCGGLQYWTVRPLGFGVTVCRWI